MIFNYSKICNGLLSDLSSRTKEIISRRFGLGTEKYRKRETLESIGRDYGITRERVRQIEEDGFFRFKSKIKDQQKVFQYFSDELKKSGNLRKEDVLLNSLGRSKFQNHVFFLLTLGEPFKRFSEIKEFYALWTTDAGYLVSAKKAINSFSNQLKKANQPLLLKDFVLPTGFAFSSLTARVTPFYIEISKIIQQGPEGLFGLTNWPEINPCGVKDWAYLILKKQKKPLHFRQTAELINKFYVKKSKTLPQTAHNELIKDQRFVLVGRGLYALKEWGYESGVVKEVISQLLKREGKPLSQKEIVEKVLNQRFVKKNTILLNLNNKKRFFKNEDGKYIIKQI